MVTEKPEKPLKKTKHRLWLFGLGMFLLGVVAVVAFRFITYKSDLVHYHANFALYINDQRDQFNNFTFYEEVSACSTHGIDNPKVWVHMHDQNHGLVHVHANGVTWGQFFANLDYALGDTLVKTDKGVYVDDQNNKQLRFVLNGQEVSTIANKVIKSVDRLLINYGDDNDETLQKHYETVPTDAPKANTQQDPATCKGTSEPSTWERLKHSAGIRSTAH